MYQGLTIGAELFGNSERVERALDFGACLRSAVMPMGKRRLTANGPPGSFTTTRRAYPVRAKKTIGYSPFVTWNLSEFNRLRFQYSYFDDDVREEKSERGNQFFLQWTTVLGTSYARLPHALIDLMKEIYYETGTPKCF